MPLSCTLALLLGEGEPCPPSDESPDAIVRASFQRQGKPASSLFCGKACLPSKVSGSKSRQSLPSWSRHLPRSFVQFPGRTSTSHLRVARDFEQKTVWQGREILALSDFLYASPPNGSIMMTAFPAVRFLGRINHAIFTDEFKGMRWG